MTRLCMFCGRIGDRKPCAEGRDRCADCLARVTPKPLPSAAGITVGVGLEKRNGIYVVAPHGDGQDHSDPISVAPARKPEGT